MSSPTTIPRERARFSVTGKTTTELQAPISNTGIYGQWGTDDWDFGSNAQYPILKYRVNPSSSEPTCDGEGLPGCSNLIAPQIRNGLQNLTLDDGITLSPAFGDVHRNLIGSYRGTILANTNAIRLIPTAKEHNAMINIYIKGLFGKHGLDQRIASGTTSSEIILEEGLNRIILEIVGTNTVQYPLYINHKLIIDRDQNGFAEIDNLDELYAIRDNLSGSYELTRSLDFYDPNSYASGEVNRSWTEAFIFDSVDADGWEPIGTADSGFVGELNANGYTISNLQINRDESNQGLFAAIGSGSIVRNLGLLGVKIEAGSNSGALAGDNAGTVIGSYAIGELSGTGKVGGLIGESQSGSVLNSYADVEVRASGNEAGGLVGKNNGTNVAIINSYAHGEVAGNSRVGGLIGTNDGLISNSYATGTVAGIDEKIGGLAGINAITASRIRDSYATGSVSTEGQDGTEEVGSLLGSMVQESKVDKSYAIGRVSSGAGSRIGALIGWYKPVNPNNLAGIDRDVTASYWDRMTVGKTRSSGGERQTTKQLQNSRNQFTNSNKVYYEWHFDDWDFGSSTQYPILKYAEDIRMSRKRTCNKDGLSDIDGLPDCGTVISPQIRHGLQNLTLGNGILLPPFGEVHRNSRGSYRGTVVADTNAIRLIPTAKENNATIDIYTDATGSIEDIHQSIASGAISSEIMLKEKGLTQIVLRVRDSSESVDYLLYLEYSYSYRGTDKAINPIAINCLDELAAIREAPNSDYELQRDLDFFDDDSYCDIASKAKWEEGDLADASGFWQYLIPEFGGIFNGNGYAISNLQINDPDNSTSTMEIDSNLRSNERRDRTGLFGTITEHGLINNLGLINPNIAGHNSVGSIAGVNFGYIAGSYVFSAERGSAGSDIFGEKNIGGIVGANFGSIFNSRALLAVAGSEHIGGVAGFNAATGQIINSYAAKDGSVTPSVHRGGGLVGINEGLIASSYAENSLLGAMILGGLVGSNAGGTIRDTYAAGPVSGDIVAGLVGVNVGIIENSYAIGNVSGNNAGGLVDVNSGKISASYWDTRTSGVSSGDHGIGRRTTQLQSPTAATGSYARWSEDHWDFGTSEQYPILKYAPGPDGNACGSASQLPQCGNVVPSGLRYAESSNGLESLTARYSVLNPSFDIEAQNAFGIYYGTVESDTPEIELIATTRESSATYSIYIGNSTAALHANIQSGNPSGIIALRTDGVTRVTLEVEGAPTIRYPLYLKYAERPAIDVDRDGLIELHYLEDFQVIAFNLEGGEIGYRSSETAVSNRVGCPQGTCRGYELQRDLDFNDPGSYRDAEANKARWTNIGWDQISLKDALFQGNGYTISNLKVRSSSGGGLFIDVDSSSIEGLGLLNVDISSGDTSAGMANTLSGSTLSNSYVIGSIEAEEGAAGLIYSAADSEIANSYFIGTIAAQNRAAKNAIGGLVSDNSGTLSINNSYVIGRLTARNATTGIGLIARRLSGQLRIENSFAAALGTRAGVPNASFVNNLAGRGLTVEQSYYDSDIAEINRATNRSRRTRHLQSPVSAAGIYSQWDEDNWDFGTAKQYPGIKYNAAECETEMPSPRCGTVQPYQGSLLKSFALVGDIGINRPFDFATFNYAIAVGADQENLQFIAEAFNPQATIAVLKDGSEVDDFASAAAVRQLALNRQGDTTVEIVVKASAIRSSYRYRFTVSRLEFPVNLADMDADADGLIDVSTAEQLSAMRYSLNGNSYKESAEGAEVYCNAGCAGFELTADIDLAGVDWQPIGTDSNRFNAHFNANGHAISNLSINRSDSNAQSLFGYVGSDATIENMRLMKFNIHGRNQIAALAAYNYGVINNSHSININLRAISQDAGGLVSINYGTIYNSSNINGSLSSNRSGGGLVATNIGGTIVNSRAIGINTNPNGDVASIGGLIGSNSGGVILSSFATGGNATGGTATGSNAGGLIGINSGISLEGRLSNSYATNSVDGNASGSLVGVNQDSTFEIINNYATGNVKGSGTEKGGLIGGIAAAGIFRNNYWNSETSGQSSSQGGTSRTTEQLQSGSANDYQWDTEHWYFGNAKQYPAIVYVAGNDTGLCREPSEAQLASCAERVPAGLNDADRSLICRDRLEQGDEAQPYCGALVPGQHLGLIHLELSDGVRLEPAFNPEIESYQLVIDDGQTAFHTTPTVYHRSNSVTLRAGDLKQVIAENTRSPALAFADYDAVTFIVQDAATHAVREYDLVIRETVGTVPEGVILIASIEDLEQLRNPPAQCASTSESCIYWLTRHLDFNDPASYRAGVVDSRWTSGTGWQPIGTDSNGFTGTFNGNGYTISNLMVNRPDARYIGFFGVLGSGARIENIGLLDVNVNGEAWVGALSGFTQTNQRSETVNSYATGTVSADGIVGGLIGRVEFPSIIVNSYADVAVEARLSTGIAFLLSGSTVSLSNTAGGLVGSISGTIYNSYALGAVRGGQYPGGLVGAIAGASIFNSYARGNVHRVVMGHSIGGFVGENFSSERSGTLQTSYSTGEVTGRQQRGSVIDFFSGNGCQSALTFQNYWNEDSAGTSDDNDQTILCANGKTTSELQSPISNTGIYNLWSLDNWDFGTSSQYPAVRYTTATDVLSRPACSDDGSNASNLPPCGALVVGQRGSFSVDQLERLLPASIIIGGDIVVDTDGNGLIEISSLEQLHAMRHRPDGRAYINNATGCPDAGCRGYELTRDLDFINPDSYDAGVVNPDWTSGAGWKPIGIAADPFTTEFIADGHTISNLLINPAGTDAVGLFGVTNGATIRGLGVQNAKVIGGKNVESVGILIGKDLGSSQIINSYATGTVRSSNDLESAASGAFDADLAAAGGLAGEYRGSIVNSYAYASVFAENYAGGLVGKLIDGRISKSYAAGRVGSSYAGGLVGWTIGSTIDNSYTSNAISGVRGSGLVSYIEFPRMSAGQSTLIKNSYAIGPNAADIRYGLASYATRDAERRPGSSSGANTITSYWGETTGIILDGAFTTYQDLPIPDDAGELKATTELQSPISSTGIYSMWLNGDWNFGTETQYPMLKYANSTDTVTHSACRETSDTSSKLPVCGSALPNQYINLQDPAFSNEVLEINPPFNPLILNYQLTLKAGATQFHITPASINPANYHIRNTNTNSERFVISGNASLPITVSASGSNTIQLSEGLLNNSEAVYIFIATHHPYLASRIDVDADDDGLIEVRTISDLNAMRYQLDGSGARASTASNKITTGCLPATGCIGYELEADIDLAGIAWEPIGTGNYSGANFEAIFDGNRDLGYKISNLAINTSNAEAIGLFAYLGNIAEVRNLVLANVAINGIAKIGGVAGYSKGTITNSEVTGSLSGNADVGSLVGKNDGVIGRSAADVAVSGISSAGNESQNIGGLAGHNTGRIINSGALANISGNTNVGSLVGINEGSAGIVNSYASGHVAGDNAVGGLAGRNGNLATIRNSYASSEVSGISSVGGLVGLNFGTLANTHASGSVVAREQGGGLVGNNRNASNAIINSYAASQVRASRDAGGLMGLGNGGVNNSYWDSIISGQLQSAGGMRKTTAELQMPTTATGIYAAWSESNWDFGTATQYPQLKYAPGGDNDMPACGVSGLPDCGDVQIRGLTNLEVAGLVVLPQFVPSRFRYAIAVELGVVTSLRVIAHAAESTAVITIIYKGQRITAENGVPSEPIMLDPTSSEAIRITVRSTRDIVEYVLELDYFSSNLNRAADADGDGLIEIATLEDLDAIRHSLDGKAYRYQQSGIFASTVAGCPATATVPVCSGYELSRDLDFTDAASYRSGVVNRDWANRWDPISGIFTASFNGNGYTLRNLRINGVGTKDGAGLFHTIGAAGRVENLNIRNLTIEGLAGGEKVGGVASENRGVIFNTHIINADIEGAGSQTLGRAMIGGLVGLNDGSDANVGNIEYSSVYGVVAARFFNTNMSHRVGALVGKNQNGAEIHNSHAVSLISASCSAGGLAAEQSTADRTNSDDISTIRNSYAIIQWNSLGGSCEGGTLNVGGAVAVNDNSDIVNSYALFETNVGITSDDVSAFNVSNIGASRISTSYWNNELYSRNRGAGSGQSTAVLQTPTTSTGIYAAWSNDDWDFGTSMQYPTLKAAAGSKSMGAWDTSLLTDITAENAAIIEDFVPLQFDYRLAVDGIQPPPQITFSVASSRSDVSIEIYCDEVRCPLAGPTTILFATTDLEEIRIVARQGNRVAEYYYTLVYDDIPFTNIDAISVNEGDTFTIMNNYSGPASGAGEILWTQIAGPFINVTSAASLLLQLQPQTDLVPRAADHSVVKFKLEAGINNQVYITREISARINKVNNGQLSDRFTLSQVNMTLSTIIGADMVDPDGGGFSNMNSPRIFQRRLSPINEWVTVSFFINGVYHLPIETLDYQYRAIQSYEDDQGYLESIVSNIVTVPGSRTADGNTDADSVLPADDIDDDNDGLIEIRYLEELDAIRHQMDGSGYRASADAELNTAGCPIGGCIGYELLNDLDFATAASYRSGAVNADWTVSNFSDADDSSWQPIDADGSNPFNAVFKGNGFKVSNLQINRSVGTKHNIGLFARIGSSGKVEGLVLQDVLIGGIEISSDIEKNVGGIAGVTWPGGVIANSSVFTEKSRTLSRIAGGKKGNVGGIVGLNRGYILNSYTDITVHDTNETLKPGTTNEALEKNTSVGGIAGRNSNGGKIHNSYAAGKVEGACVVGGLAGSQYTTDASVLETLSEIRNSYVSSEVDTGFGNCSSNNIIGGIVGRNTNSIIANTYMSGVIRSQADTGNCIPNTSVSALAGIIEDGMSVGIPADESTDPSPRYSYWNSGAFNASCRVSGSATYAIYYDSYNRLLAAMQNPTGPNVSSNNCSRLIDGTLFSSQTCTTYENWNEDDWHFGASSEFPRVKYAIGLDRENPGCGFGVAGLPQCGSLVGSQSSAAPVPALDPPPVHSLPQARIRYALNGSALAALGARNIIELNEGDTLTLDAANSFTGGDIVLDYLWKQVRGPALLSQSVSVKSYTFNVGDALVPADANSEEAVLRLEIRGKDRPDALVPIDVRVMIAKTNSNGEIRINPVGETLLHASEINDADGGPFTDISYQWQQNTGNGFADIVGANQAIYKRAVGAQNILLVTTYTDGQGYSNTVVAIAPPPSPSSVVDQDGDGLIEIAAIEQLLAMHNQLDGSGYKANPSATLNTEGCPNSGCKGYELVRDLDFRDTNSYTGTTLITNWTAGANGDPFTAIFEGNGFMISNLQIASEASANLVSNTTARELGLFGVVAGDAEIRRVRLRNVSIVGADEIGALVGDFRGNKIIDSHVISGTVTTFHDGGCMVGHSSGEIIESSANCQISGNRAVGGLAGRATGQIHNSFASSTVTGGSDAIAGSMPATGGLVGISETAISDSYATGNVRGTDKVGGLVGEVQSNAEVTNSFALGDVTGNTQVGGLIGLSSANIRNSYATGTVRASRVAGGLVGHVNASNVNNSFALGNVSANADRAGGLIGFIENGRISNSHASGDVRGSNNVAGLVGVLSGEIRDSYAVGKVSGDSNVAALVGLRQGTTSIRTSYWSTDNGIPSSMAGRGFSSKALRSATAPGTNASRPYTNWSNDHWNFGFSDQYPAIKYNDDSCTTTTPTAICGMLLRRQRPGLQGIRVSQIGKLEQPRIFPRFNTTRTDYTAYINSNAVETKITLTAANPDSLISINGGAALASSADYLLSSNFSDAKMITLQVAEPGAFESDTIEYRLSFNRFPTVGSITATGSSGPLAAPVSIREGDSITLSSEILDADGDDLSYQWILELNGNRLSQDSGMIDGSGIASLNTGFADNLIASDQSAANAIFSLIVKDNADDMIMAVEEIEFIINKHNNDTIGAIGAPTRVGLTYIASRMSASELILDSDGPVNPSNVRYQWQEQHRGVWSDIAGAMARSYTIGSESADYYRVIVGYTDGQGYEAEIVSDAAEGVSLDELIEAESASGRAGFIDLNLSAKGLSPNFSRRGNERLYGAIGNRPTYSQSYCKQWREKHQWSTFRSKRIFPKHSTGLRQ